MATHPNHASRFAGVIVGKAIVTAIHAKQPQPTIISIMMT